MRITFVPLAIPLAVTAILVASCSDERDDDDLQPPPGGVAVTLTSEGATVEPEQVDFGSLFLTMSNQTDGLRSVAVIIHGSYEESLEFGIAPGETRSELVGTEYEGGLNLYWDDGALQVESVNGPPIPSPSPELKSCPSTEGGRAGYVEGFSDGSSMERDTGLLSGDSYLANYAYGYRDGYLDGAADGHFGRRKGITEDLKDYVAGYARGYEDGHEDGYEVTTTGRLPQDHRDHYFTGFADAILGERNLCDYLADGEGLTD